MMPNMMPGMETYMFFWLVAGWLKKQRTPMVQNTPRPRDAYEGYEQGYQPQPPETYQEGGQRYAYPQNEQPQAQYQEMEQLQH